MSIFLLVLVTFTKIRRSLPILENIPCNLTVLIPPLEEDFAYLQKSSKGGKENARGEKNKYEKKRTAKAKFPLRTLEIRTDFYKKYLQDYFIDADFVMMNFLITLFLFVVIQPVKVFMPEWIDSNLSMYLMFTTSFMIIYQLAKRSFSETFKSDELRVETFFAAKALITSYILLRNEGYLDF